MNDRKITRFNRLTDRQLVALLLANDEEAVEYVFFHRCDGMFAHIVSSIYPEAENKEDLISEFYLYLSSDNWLKLRKFEFKSKLNTWLTVVAVRFFSGKITVAQTKTVSMTPQIYKEAKTIADEFDIEHEMTKMELYEAIDRISKPRERYALLGEMTGKRAEQISKELGCTVSAVYNLTKRARMALRKMIGGR